MRVVYGGMKMITEDSIRKAKSVRGPGTGHLKTERERLLEPVPPAPSAFFLFVVKQTKPAGKSRLVE